MGKRCAQGAVLSLLLSFSCLIVPAQQPQSAVTCARPEFQLFLPLVGHWKVKWKNRIAPGKYEDTTGTARLDRDPIGCLLVEHFFGTVNGRQFTALIMLNFGNSEGYNEYRLTPSTVSSSNSQVCGMETLCVLNGSGSMIRAALCSGMNTGRLKQTHSIQEHTYQLMAARRGIWCSKRITSASRN